MSLKKIGLAAILSLAALPALAQQTQTVRIGATPGPHAQILEAVKPIAAKKGIDIKIVEFSDYVVPNTALAGGDIEANSFQNQPYLDNQVADRGYKIESVALTVNFPIGIYSKKHKSLDALPNGATISIPNDPTNGGRALILLQDKGLIKLKEGTGYKPTPSFSLMMPLSCSSSSERPPLVGSFWIATEDPSGTSAQLLYFAE